MTNTVRTILEIADGGVKYKTEKLPKIKIKQESPMPSLRMFSIIAITFVLLFCVFSIVQMLDIKTEIYDMQKQRTELKTDLKDLENKTEARYTYLNSISESNN